MTLAPDESGERPQTWDDPAIAVGEALSRAGRVVLAVSGGRDSMALLDAAARVAPTCVALVATFDHGTGAAATAGVDVGRTRSGAVWTPLPPGPRRSS